jgi:hypothetical protein
MASAIFAQAVPAGSLGGGAISGDDPQAGNSFGLSPDAQLSQLAQAMSSPSPAVAQGQGLLAGMGGGTSPSSGPVSYGLSPDTRLSQLVQAMSSFSSNAGPLSEAATPGPDQQIFQPAQTIAPSYGLGGTHT